MTPDERRAAELARGAAVSAAHAMSVANRVLSREFNPDHIAVDTPDEGSPQSADFHKRKALDYLPNNRDGTPRGT